MPRLPCPRCTRPVVSRAWETSPAGGGRPVIHHADGTSCYPPSIDEAHEVRCSSCGEPVRFRLIVLMGTIAGGVSDRLACSCGARWRAVSRLAEGMSLYLVV